MLNCNVCRYEDFLTPWYQEWAVRLGLPVVSADAEAAGLIVHRKHWEWCAIAQALHERGMLGPGRTGCGFAVGQEPLASAFACLGTRVLATDQASEGSAEVWLQTGQHANGLDNVYVPTLISRTEFDAHVSFRPVDMRDLQLPWPEAFDFIWSSCAVEHLGNPEAGWQFILSSMELVKPGGVAVHTIEFNVASDTETLTSGETVIYRRQDIEDLDLRLRSIACGLSQCEFFAGDDWHDIDFDYPPYFQNDRPHVKLLIHGHVATSFLLIIRKGTKGEGVSFRDAPAGVEAGTKPAKVAGQHIELIRRWSENVQLNHHGTPSDYTSHDAACLERWEEAARFIPLGARVLDIGSGHVSQATLQFVRSRGYRYHFLDTDADCVTFSRNRGLELGMDASRFQKRCDYTVNFENAYFDSVFASQRIEIGYDLLPTLRELNRVLERGGNLIMTVSFGWETKPERPYFLGPTEWLSLIADTGFEIAVAQISCGRPEYGQELFICARKESHPTASFRLNPEDFRRSRFKFVPFDAELITVSGATQLSQEHVVAMDPDWRIDIKIPHETSEVLPVMMRHNWSAIVEAEWGRAKVIEDLYSWFSFIQPIRIQRDASQSEIGKLTIRPIGRNISSFSSQGVLCGVLYR